MSKIKIISLGNSRFFYLYDKLLLCYMGKLGRRLYELSKKFFKFLLDSNKYRIIDRFVNNQDIHNPTLFSWIEIETLNRCNGKCSFCPVNALAPQRKYAKMDGKLFRKIIDELSEIDYRGNINLFSNNEPFLDERIYEFAEYTRNKVPKAKISILTNGLLLNIDNVDKILPYIDLLYIDNYSDSFKLLPTVKQIYDYGKNKVDYVKKILISVRLQNEILSTRGGESPNNKTNKINAKCTLPFKQIVVRPDGKISLCCNDALGKMTLGDVNTDSLMNIWLSDMYRNIRHSIQKNGRTKIKLCENCDFASIEY